MVHSFHDIKQALLGKDSKTPPFTHTLPLVGELSGVVVQSAGVVAQDNNVVEVAGNTQLFGSKADVNAAFYPYGGGDDKNAIEANFVYTITPVAPQISIANLLSSSSEDVSDFSFLVIKEPKIQICNFNNENFLCGYSISGKLVLSECKSEQLQIFKNTFGKVFPTGELPLSCYCGANFNKLSLSPDNIGVVCDLVQTRVEVFQGVALSKCKLSVYTSRQGSLASKWTLGFGIAADFEIDLPGQSTPLLLSGSVDYIGGSLRAEASVGKWKKAFGIVDGFDLIDVTLSFTVDSGSALTFLIETTFEVSDTTPLYFSGSYSKEAGLSFVGEADMFTFADLENLFAKLFGGAKLSPTTPLCGEVVFYSVAISISLKERVYIMSSDIDILGYLCAGSVTLSPQGVSIVASLSDVPSLGELTMQNPYIGINRFSSTSATTTELLFGGDIAGKPVRMYLLKETQKESSNPSTTTTVEGGISIGKGGLDVVSLVSTLVRALATETDQHTSLPDLPAVDFTKIITITIETVSVSFRVEVLPNDAAL